MKQLAHILNYPKVANLNVNDVRRGLQSRIRGRMHVILVERIARDIARIRSRQWLSNPILQ